MPTFVVLRFGSDPPQYVKGRRVYKRSPDRWWATMCRVVAEEPDAAPTPTWWEEPFDTQTAAACAAHRFSSKRAAQAKAGYTKMGRRRVFTITEELGALIDFAELT